MGTETAAAGRRQGDVGCAHVRPGAAAIRCPHGPLRIGSSMRSPRPMPARSFPLLRGMLGPGPHRAYPHRHHGENGRDQHAASGPQWVQRSPLHPVRRIIDCGNEVVQGRIHDRTCGIFSSGDYDITIFCVHALLLYYGSCGYLLLLGSKDHATYQGMRASPISRQCGALRTYQRCTQLLTARPC
jgi:hypothetical protein